MTNRNDEPNVFKIIVAAGAALTIVIVGAVGVKLGLSHLSIVTSRLAGQAAFAHSESERKVLVSQAEAELEAAKLRAEAIKIVGEVAQKYPEYRDYLGISKPFELISIPQRFACDDIQSLIMETRKRIEKSNSKVLYRTD